MYLVMAKQIYSLHTFIFYEKEGAEKRFMLSRYGAFLVLQAHDILLIMTIC